MIFNFDIYLTQNFVAIQIVNRRNFHEDQVCQVKEFNTISLDTPIFIMRLGLLK